MHRISIAVALASSCLMPVGAMAQDTGTTAQPTSPAADQTTTPVDEASAASSETTPTPEEQEFLWTNEVTAGLQWVGGTNTGLFGRYNGLTNEGLDLVAAFAFRHRDPGDSGNTFYYDLTGTDLVVQTGRRLEDHFSDRRFRESTNNDIGPESSIALRVGRQGDWGIDAGYDAITYTGNIISSIYTVNGATGTLNNGFPAFGGATNDPLQVGPITGYTAPQLMEAERRFQTGTRRDIFHLNGKQRIGQWTIASGIRHEHKEGSLEQSLRENWGGIAFTQPVDYDTDRFDISAAYNTPRLQAVAQFTYSRFQNHNLGVALPYAVSQAAITGGSGPPARAALYSLPPDNSALYLTGMLGYNFAPRTRLTLNGRIGLELQDDTFPANNADPNLSRTLGNPAFQWFDNLNSFNQGTSAKSPNARALIYEGNLAIDSGLTNNLDGRLSYTFDGRHVRLNQFGVWMNGHAPEGPAIEELFVVPQNWFKQTAKAEATYHLRRASNTKFWVAYAFNDTHRSNAQVRHSTTHTETVQLSSMLGKAVMARATYEHADRSGRLIYGFPWGNLELGEPEIDGTPSGAYYQAPMTSNSVTFRADYASIGKFSGGLFLRYADERFHYPRVDVNGPPGTWNLVGRGLGVVRDYNFTVGPDINYRPRDGLNFHLYYTYERIFFDNRGNGACAENNIGNCAGSVGFFKNKYTSGVHTAGFNTEWQATPKLKLLADYTMSFGSVMFGEYNGVVVPNPTQSYQNVISYPDIHSRLYDLSLSADYRIAPNVEWALLYRFSKFHNNDWNDLAAPVQPTTDGGTNISILTPGYPPPRYSVSVIGTAVRVRF